MYDEFSRLSLLSRRGYGIYFDGGSRVVHCLEKWIFRKFLKQKQCNFIFLENFSAKISWSIKVTNADRQT
jgi:hypothetical protein